MSAEPHTERILDAIIVGVRHRKDLGDIDELAHSINEIGMLQPITITPDGVLVCGHRRLEAVRRLGGRTIKVWIRSGISNRLTELLAQRDENSLHKPLSPTEHRFSRRPSILRCGISRLWSRSSPGGLGRRCWSGSVPTNMAATAVPGHDVPRGTVERLHREHG